MEGTRPARLDRERTSTNGRIAFAQITKRGGMILYSGAPLIDSPTRGAKFEKGLHSEAFFFVAAEILEATRPTLCLEATRQPYTLK